MTTPPSLPADSALFLDFDGTLAEIAPHPDAVQPAAGLPELLMRLQALLGDAVAMITGRPLEQLRGFLEPASLHGAGLHGAELGWRNEPARRLGNFDLSHLATALRGVFGNDERLYIEDKQATVALHFRLAPERAAECQDAMQQHAQALGLEVIHGKALVEARPPGVNKGRAIATLMEQAPFRGRKPIFIGDDTTDEDGFRYVLAKGGMAVKVGAGPSRAPHRLPDVTAVHAWLADSARQLAERA